MYRIAVCSANGDLAKETRGFIREMRNFFGSRIRFVRFRSGRKLLEHVRRTAETAEKSGSRDDALDLAILEPSVFRIAEGSMVNNEKLLSQLKDYIRVIMVHFSKEAGSAGPKLRRLLEEHPYITFQNRRHVPRTLPRATDREFLYVKDKDRQYRIRRRDIHFCTKERNYLVIHKAKERIVTRGSLEQLEYELKWQRYRKGSRSYLVNPDHIALPDDDGTMVLDNGLSIPLKKHEVPDNQARKPSAVAEDGPARYLH